nr:zf-HC2 domain-containing protein [Phytoactinopolyspora mesophila]
MIEAYVDDNVAEADAWSIEAHVMECEHCRRAVAAASAGQPRITAQLTSARTAVLDNLPAQGRIRRGTAIRALRMLLASGPAARGPWLLATLMTLALAVGLELTVGGTGLFGSTAPVLLLLAPVLPVLGVAVSYGSGLDDAYEVIATTPSGGLRLLLIRTAAVLAVTVPATVAAGLLADIGWSVTWLLPGLTLTVLTLLLGTSIGIGHAAAVIGSGWAVVVVSDIISDTGLTLLTETATAAWLAALGLGATAVVFRREAFNHLHPQIRTHSEA